MRLSLSVQASRERRRESPLRWLFRHAIVIWLLVVEPAALAFTLDRALPRMPAFGVTAWTIVAVRIALVGLGIAVARRLADRDASAWRGVAAWACAAIGATLLARLWPELPTGLAPSEARVVAWIVVAADATLALVAVWLARADAALQTAGAAARDSS
jgi:hypothetical protein